MWEKSPYTWRQYFHLTKWIRPQTRYSKVERNIYGTPQASKVYTSGAYKLLLSHGYRQLHEDINVFVKSTPSSFIGIALTIDDFIVGTTADELYQDLLRLLSSKYRVKDLGPASHIIGWRVQRDLAQGTLHLSQPKVAAQVIDALQLQDAAPVPTHGDILSMQPLPTKTSHIPFNPLTERHWESYDTWWTVPGLTLLTLQVYSHDMLIRPTKRHWTALRTLGRYIKGTASLGLLYTKGTDCIVAQSDAANADCEDTSQSTASFRNLSHAEHNFMEKL